MQAVAFYPGGRAFLTASDDKTARIKGTATGTEFLRAPHDIWGFEASFGPEKKTFVSDGTDNTLPDQCSDLEQIC
jgi:hypothetical protein